MADLSFEDRTQAVTIVDGDDTTRTLTVNASGEILVTGAGGGASDTDDGSVAAAQTVNLSTALNMGYDGAAWERITSTSNALDVNIASGATSGPTDTDDGSIVTGQSGGLSIGLGYGFGGSTWERLKSTSGALDINIATGLISDSDDGSIAAAQTTNLDSSLTMGFDGAAWERINSTSNRINTQTIITDGTTDAEVTGDGRLKVDVTTPSAPSGTTPVNRGTLSEIASGSTVDDLYTITNGDTLTILSFTGSSASNSASSKGAIEFTLYEDPNGDLSVLNLIKAAHLEDGNFQFLLNRDFVGDGTRRILLRVEELAGQTLRVSRFWDGFEQ